MLVEVYNIAAKMSMCRIAQQRKLAWRTAGKRKRQDLQTETSDCCTAELSELQLPSTRHTGRKSGVQGAPSSRVHPKTTGKQVHKVSEQAAVTTSSHKKSTRAAKQVGSKQQTRLAIAASAVDAQDESAVAEQAAQANVCATSVPDSDDDGMPDATVGVSPPVVQPDTTLQPVVVTDKGAEASSSGGAHGKFAGVIPVLLPGGSSRFSSRHLHQKVEAKLPVSKATPVGLPPTPLMPPVPQ